MEINKLYDESIALVRYPKKGKCTDSCFANGWHRVGIIPSYSLLDGGIPGDIYRERCMECDKEFRKGYFLPIPGQPREIKKPLESDDASG